jgi:hypothetical protein
VKRRRSKLENRRPSRVQAKAVRPAKDLEAVSELLRRSLGSLAIVVLVAIAVQFVALRSREEIYLLVPPLVRALFVAAMILLSSKLGILFSALKLGRRGQSQRAKQLFAADQITGVFILAVVCLVLFFLYQVPLMLEVKLGSVFSQFRQGSITVISWIITTVISGVVGNAGYAAIKYVIARAFALKRSNAEG